MKFMSALTVTLEGVPCFVTRSGYTGEDGYEISIPAEKAEAFAKRLLDQPEVKPVGLGARDSLRLEAGLCLYGHDIDWTTSPVEAGLVWSIGKRRRAEGGFPGAPRIQRELEAGPSRKRVGILPEGRAPVRDNTELMSDGKRVGKVTSGGFGPSLGGPVAMGYVETSLAKPGQKLEAIVRGKPLPVQVAPLPFVKANYYRG
jgi:aminomethyltransferase